jgi:FKBP-type peptidyl-prolyl cis-trans isomerase (trigger factor)
MTEIKKLSDSEIEITAEISAEEFDTFYASALKKYKETMELPGFRKGMMPEKMVIEKVGEESIMHEAVELALKIHWPRIIKEEKIEPIAQPEISITKIAKGNPLEFKIKATILPEIILPEYKEIAKEVFKEKNAVVITNEEIEKTIVSLKEKRASIKPEEGKEMQPLPPEDELKKAIKENLQFEKEAKERDERRMNFLEKISGSMKFNPPEDLINAEVEKMVQELKNSISQMQLSWDQYLEHAKKKEEDLRKEWHDQAKKRVLFGLALRTIAQQENIVPSEEMLEKNAEELMQQWSPEEREKLSKAKVKEHLFGRLQHELLFDFLEKLI